MCPLSVRFDADIDDNADVGFWLDLLQSVSIIAASVAAVWGITAWRREYVGRRRIDLAEEVLAGFYEARDAIVFIRSPLTIEGEGTTRKPKGVELKDEKRIRDRAYIVRERMHKQDNLFSRLEALQYRFAAVFGQDNIRPFRDLVQVIRDIILASDQIGELVKGGSVYFRALPDVEKANHLQRLVEMDRLLWATRDQDDITTRLNNIVAEIVAMCRPVIDKKSVLRRIGDTTKRWWRSWR